MSASKKLRWGVGVVIAAAVGIQFVPVERTNPPVTREVRWDSKRTAELARASCYDCHSNETKWPWYSYVAPVSWLIVKDVLEGREHLNFSTWDRPNEDADEILEMVRTGEMPLRPYTWLHPEARLSEEERSELLEGLRATLANDPPIVTEVHEERTEEHGH